MTEHQKSSPKDNLDARIKAARAQHDDSAPRRGKLVGSDASGLGIGMRVATEIVAGIGVGVGIGILLDRWLGTKPWLMLVFTLLGTGAAFLNVVRTAKELERKAKARREREQASKDAGADEGKG